MTHFVVGQQQIMDNFALNGMNTCGWVICGTSDAWLGDLWMGDVWMSDVNVFIIDNVDKLFVLIP